MGGSGEVVSNRNLQPCKSGPVSKNMHASCMVWVVCTTPSQHCAMVDLDSEAEEESGLMGAQEAVVVMMLVIFSFLNMEDWAKN
jgi:hypothetical protein